jgi:hypothetical protein
VTRASASPVKNLPASIKSHIKRKQKISMKDQKASSRFQVMRTSDAPMLRSLETLLLLPRPFPPDHQGVALPFPL